jgi:hypothetical protein
MLLQGVSSPHPENDNRKYLKQFPKRKSKSKRKTVANLTLEQQVTCFAEIIVHQLLKDLNCYENK